MIISLDIENAARKDPVFDLLIKSLLQKEMPLHGDLASVNQVFNMPTITSGNLFDTNYDVVDYSTGHILSYLVADLNDY
jgi:hypothetical protein